jgi:hypothetical protein
VPAGEHVFQDGHAAEQLDILEGAGQSQAGPAVGRQTCQVFAFQENGAGGGWKQAVDDIEAGGFAGAVGADEGQDLPGSDVEAHLIQGPHPAEVLAEGIHRQDRHSHTSR